MINNNLENLALVYVRPIGKNSNDFYEYEFFFSENPETVWGEDWNVICPSACNDLTPTSDMYSIVKRLKTIIPLQCAQENSCFSMADVIDGILALCFENINDYPEYPEPYRLVFKFAEPYKEVEDALAGRQQLFIDDDSENLNKKEETINSEGQNEDDGDEPF